MSKRPPKVTTSELVRRLAADPKSVAARVKEDALRAQRLERIRRAGQPIVDDLATAGFPNTTEWDLAGCTGRYDSAIPALLKHLRLNYPDRIREGLARALARPWARAEAWAYVLALYQAEPNHLAGGPLDAVGSTKGPKEGMAEALSAMATPDDLDQLIALFTDAKNGATRLFFIAHLTRSRSQKALEALVRMRNDPELSAEIEKRLERKLRRASRGRLDEPKH